MPDFPRLKVSVARFRLLIAESLVLAVASRERSALRRWALIAQATEIKHYRDMYYPKQ